MSEMRILHVSFHVPMQELATCIDFLTRVVGLVEVERPQSVTVPGAWLQVGNAQVHLNARDMEVTSPGRGSAPNHLCLAVPDLNVVVERLDAVGFHHETSGTVGVRQVWLRGPANLVVELQESI